MNIKQYMGIDLVPEEADALKALELNFNSNNSNQFLFEKMFKQQIPYIEKWPQINSNVFLGFMAENGHVIALFILGFSLTEIPKEINSFSFLRSLNFDYNCLSNFTFKLDKMQNLRGLHLNSNSLDKIPEELKDLTELTHLYLRNNELTEIPGWIDNLKNLKMLDLFDNKFTNLPDSICNLSALEFLFIGFYEELTFFAVKAREENNIVDQYTKAPKFEKLPQNFANLRSLKHLNLINLGLNKLPEEIKKLTNLTTLNVQYNYLQDLPDWIENFGDLQNLYLDLNPLKTLPSSIGNLINLHVLSIKGTKISKFPLEILNLVNLEEFFLEYGDYEDIPEFIKNFQSLKILNLNNNLFTKIPPWISCLTNLEILDLRNNRLELICTEIASLSNLKKLDLSHNKIKTIPHHLANLASLERLNLDHNLISNLAKIPSEFLNIPEFNIKKQGPTRFTSWKMEKDSAKLWDTEGIKKNLSTLSLYILAYEIFKKNIIKSVESFYDHGFNQDGIILAPEYDREVALRTDRKGKIYVDKFAGSIHWLFNKNEITLKEKEEIFAIKKHRNDIAHQIENFMFDSDYSIKVEHFINLRKLNRKIGLIPIKLEYLATHPDIIDIEDSEIVGGPGTLLDYVINIANPDFFHILEDKEESI